MSESLYEKLAEAQRRLDENPVPTEGRWLIANPRTLWKMGVISLWQYVKIRVCNFFGYSPKL